MNFCSEISCLIPEGQSVDSPAVVLAARRYWSGEAGDDPLWEGLCGAARILSVEEF